MTLRAAQISFRVVGAVAMICALLGLVYNASTFYAMVSGAADDFETSMSAPYMKHAFFSLSLVYASLYVLLFWCGARFWALSAGLWWLFTAVLAVEVLVFWSSARSGGTQHTA